jgi:hypothetical protein
MKLLDIPRWSKVNSVSFYGTPFIITVFTRARQTIRPRPNPFYEISPIFCGEGLLAPKLKDHPVSQKPGTGPHGLLDRIDTHIIDLKRILILSDLRQGLPNSIFSACFTSKMLYAFLISHAVSVHVRGKLRPQVSNCS